MNSISVIYQVYSFLSSIVCCNDDIHWDFGSNTTLGYSLECLLHGNEWVYTVR